MGHSVNRKCPLAVSVLFPNLPAGAAFGLISRHGTRNNQSKDTVGVAARDQGNRWNRSHGRFDATGFCQRNGVSVATFLELARKPPSDSPRQQALLRPVPRDGFVRGWSTVRLPGALKLFCLSGMPATDLAGTGIGALRAMGRCSPDLPRRFIGVRCDRYA